MDGVLERSVGMALLCMYLGLYNQKAVGCPFHRAGSRCISTCLGLEACMAAIEIYKRSNCPSKG